MKKNIRINVFKMINAIYCLYLACVCIVLLVGGNLCLGIITIDIMKGLGIATIAITFILSIVLTVYKYATTTK